MSECLLLEDKTEKESTDICLNCPLPECNPDQVPRALHCKKCGGNLFSEDGVFSCLQCGAEHTKEGGLLLKRTPLSLSIAKTQ